MRIIKLESENIKKLRAIEITPTGDLVVIAGRNDAGKSSVLDSIAMALGGAALIPGQPVRKGTKGGKVTVDLGEFIVTRTFTANGGGALTVENRDGARYKSPQAMLDRILGELTFDPLAFEREDPKTQTDILRKLVGLDTSDLDLKRGVLYEDRTDKNREVKALEVTVESHEAYPDVPETEVSIAGILDALSLAEQLQQKATRAYDSDVEALRVVDRIQEKLDDDMESIVQLRNQMAALEDAIEANEKELSNAILARTERAKAHVEAVQAVPDTTELREQVKQAEITNRAVRINQQRTSAVRNLEYAKAESAELSTQIAAIDSARASRIAAASFPVPGLSISDDGGIVLDGLPFDQASTSARLRVSVAIGLAMNPKLRVLLVRDGSLLDSNNLALIAEMAQAADAQVWLEKMTESPEGGAIFIEDGTIVQEAAVTQ